MGSITSNEDRHEGAETRRSIFWHRREPSRPCERCGHPYGLHRGDCASPVRETAQEVRR